MIRTNFFATLLILLSAYLPASKASNSEFNYGEVLGKYFGSLIYVQELSVSSCPSDVLDKLIHLDFETEKKSLRANALPQFKSEIDELFRNELYIAKIRYDARKLFDTIRQEGYSRSSREICGRWVSIFNDAYKTARDEFNGFSSEKYGYTSND